MARIAKTFTFEAGHRLKRHDGKCRRLHGHSYRVEVRIEGPVQEDIPPGVTSFVNAQTGMVFDFSMLKAWWQPLEAMLDHSMILETGDSALDALLQLGEPVVEFHSAPTAENIAGYILEDLQNWLLNNVWRGGFPTPTVRVWETATSWAEA